MEWYYDTGAGPEGPVDEEAITRMLSDGTLSPQTPVRKEGREEWRPVGELYEFEELVPAVGAEPPPPPEPVSPVNGSSSSEALDGILKPLKQRSLILWFAFTGSLFMYLMVVAILAQEAEGEVTVDGKLVSALSIAGFVVGVVGLLFRRHAFSPGRLRSKLHGGLTEPTFSGPPATPAAATHQARFEAMSVQDRQVYLLIRSLLVPRIICFACFEAVAIFGVILGILTKDVSETLPFVVVAVFLNVTIFPRLDALRQRAQGWR